MTLSFDVIFSPQDKRKEQRAKGQEPGARSQEAGGRRQPFDFGLRIAECGLGDGGR